MGKIFFSWQADRPTLNCRNFVHRALEEAIKLLEAEIYLEDADRPEIEIDSDTKGVPGTPPIFDTILKKIDAAAAVVADVTFVGERSEGRRTPNPNVMIEYGWALKARGWERMVCVMNTVYGDPKSFALPFDMGHMVHPITFQCAEDADEATRAAERKKLTSMLKSKLALILAQDVPPPAPRKPFIPLEPLDGHARFRASTEPIGMLHDGSPLTQKQVPVFMPDGPLMWLRVMPKFAADVAILNTELRKALVKGGHSVLPLNLRGHAVDLYGIRGPDGHGLGAVLTNSKMHMVIYAFDSGEIWSLDAATPSYDPNRLFFSTTQFTKALIEFAALLDSLGVAGPYRWIAGLDGIEGKVLQPEGVALQFTPAACLVKSVEREGDFSGNPKDAALALEPFFAAVFDAGDLTRS